MTPPMLDEPVMEEESPLARAAERAEDAAGRAAAELEEGFGNAKEEIEGLIGTLGAQMREYVDRVFDERLARGDGGQIAGFGPRLVVAVFLIGAGIFFAGAVVGATVALIAFHAAR